MWCTVRTTTTRRPSLRSRPAARAAMQSCACRMCGLSPSSRRSPSVSLSMEANTRSSSVGAHGGASMIVYGAATSRKKPACGSPSA